VTVGVRRSCNAEDIEINFSRCRLWWQEIKVRLWRRLWWGLVGVWSLAVGFVLVRLAGIRLQSLEDVFTFNLIR
jgi:hypothetical protein